MSSNVKSFKQVKIGDRGLDYFDEPGTIVDKGTLQELEKKYRESEGMTIQELIDDELADWSDKGVMVKLDEDEFPTLSGLVFYTYDSPGFRVLKN